MSLFVIGMEMPKNCHDCPFNSWMVGYKCNAAGRKFDYGETWGERQLWCPLRPLPKEHGPLVDVCAAYDKIAEQEGGNYVDMDLVGRGLDETPTIIEAEE